MKEVRFGSVTLRVQPWRHPSGRAYWQFRYYDRGQLRKVTRAKKGAAIEEALRIAKRLSGDSVEWEDVPREIRAEVVALVNEGATLSEWKEWRLSRATTQRTLAEVVAAYAEHRKAGAAGYSRHAEDVRRVHARVVEVLGGEIMRTIDRGTLQGWLDAQQVGPKRRRDMRAMLVQLWEWARLEGDVTSPTAAERLAKVKQPPRHKIRIFSAEEMRFVVGAVGEVYLPWVVLAGFSGLRSEEIRAQDTRAKPPLDWSHVGEDYIEVPAMISKVRRRRLVPIHSTLRSWLDVIDRPKRGPIVPGSPSSWELGKLSAAMDEHFKRAEGWPPNVLRHSFGSYHAAHVCDLPALAIEMGNSEAIIRRHYQEATTKAAAEEYFGVVPA